MRKFALLTFITVLIGACHSPSPNTLTVGTIAGPETEVAQVAAQVAKQKYGLNVKIIEFSDYNLPNAALQDGSLDANVYQHLPYLKSSMKAHGYALQAIGKTFIYPTAIYSKKIKSLKELPDHAIIAIPNDPSNEARALLLLQTAGLITLKLAPNATIHDIINNPKQLQFKELDAAQLPRVLDDVDAAIINTTFAIPAGLTPSQHAIYSENKDSPYANLIVIRRDSPKKAQLLTWVKALHSEPVKQKAHELFGEGAVAAWD
jgi:D-methionine transport system substrate-binding protein